MMNGIALSCVFFLFVLSLVGSADAFCGAPEHSYEEMMESERHVKEFIANQEVTSDMIYINVYWHVISQTNSTSGKLVGKLNFTQIENQIAYMNLHYAPMGFYFDLVKVDDYTNDSWVDILPFSDIDREMKTQTRLGTPMRDLNIWSTKMSIFLGFAYLPYMIVKSNQSNDGVIIDYRSLDDDNFYGMRLIGGTVVHEAGHWLGLYHTFHNWNNANTTYGICEGLGDLIDDTPAESLPGGGYAFQCPPINPDSCPLQLGLDPIHNFMDYSDDQCKIGFTQGQAVRARQQFAAFRETNSSSTTSGLTTSNSMATTSSIATSNSMATSSSIATSSSMATSSGLTTTTSAIISTGSQDNDNKILGVKIEIAGLALGGIVILLLVVIVVLLAVLIKRRGSRSAEKSIEYEPLLNKA